MAHQRYHSLDFLRAVMMFLGVALHGAQMYMAELTTDDYYLDPMRSLSMDVILVIINTFRMPIFFFLSGFFIALLMDKRGLSGMLENRVKRITIPFLVLLPPLGLIMGGLTILGANWLHTGEAGFDLQYIDNPFKLVDKTHNLWFLYYLTMHFLTAVLIVLVFRRFRLRFHGILTVQSAKVSLTIYLLVFAALLALIGSYSDAGRIKASVVFWPALDVYLYFGVCFVAGWCLYYCQWMIEVFERHAWKLMTSAWICLFISVPFFALQGAAGDQYWLYHSGLSVFSGLSVSVFIVAFVGVFQRFFNYHSDKMRYFSDSAYWVFVSHSIFLVAIAIPMAHLQWPAEVKFTIVVAGASYACMLTYKYWVRSTSLGILFNGRKYPRA